MSKFLIAAAILSLTVHVSMLRMNSATASNTSATSFGATGNSCQPVECSVNNVNDYCYYFNDCAGSGTMCTDDSKGFGTYQTQEQSNATKCVTYGPVVGGGCTSVGSSYCKMLRTCTCSAYNDCIPGQDEEGGLYSPCEAL